MAIQFGSNLVHFNNNLALVDQDQTFGGFKNHIQNLVGFDGLVDAYIDNATDYFSFDLWGKYKPYGTFIYAVNGNDLLVKTPQEVIDEGLVLGTDYFQVTDEDGNTINVVVDTINPSPAFFTYTGNTDYLNVGPNVWDATFVNVYEEVTIDGVSKARPKYWTNVAGIVGGTADGLVDLSITGAVFDGSSSLSEATPTTFDQVVLGDLSGNAADGYTIEFATNQDIWNAVSYSSNTVVQGVYFPNTAAGTNIQSLGSIGWRNGLDSGRFVLEVNPDVNLKTNGLDSTGQISGAAGLTVASNNIAQFSVGNSVVVGGVATPDVANQPEFNIYSPVVTFHNAGYFSGTGTILSIESASGELQLTNESSIVDTAYADLVETIEGTVNQITVTGGVGQGPDQFEGDVVVSLADQLILGNVSGGSVTVGGDPLNGGYEIGITVHGDAVITGSLQVDGGIINTTSTEVSFEDTILSLGVARDNNGNVEPTSWATVVGNGDVGIEAFAGAEAGNTSNNQYSRPYIVYDYNYGGESMPGTANTYGKWVLANHYVDSVGDGTGTWSAVQGAILTTVDVNLVDLSVNDDDLHEPIQGDSNLKHLVSAYQLTNFTTSTIGGDSVDRRFGRVARTTHSYNAGDANTAITVNHGLNTHDVVTIAVVVQQGAGSSLPTAGNVVYPKSQPGGTADERLVKVNGTVNGDQVKFVFIG